MRERRRPGRRSTFLAKRSEEAALIQGGLFALGRVYSRRAQIFLSMSFT